MPRRLISTDLDGTIVFNGTISLRDREAMARWRAAGNLLVINTGRSVSALVSSRSSSRPMTLSSRQRSTRRRITFMGVAWVAR